MDELLINHSQGLLGFGAYHKTQTNRLLNAIQPANVYFRGCNSTNAGAGPDQEDKPLHSAGINSIVIDRFDGADSSIAIWDLETGKYDAGSKSTFHSALGYVKRTSATHNLGFTHVSYYAFDSQAFLTSSYDYTLKLFDSETLTASASFNLESIVYSHAMSPIAQHVLVAGATQNPTVRLVDLRTGANTHSLSGHTGAVLAVAWSPVDENVLASGSTDGTIRFWDVRRSNAALGMLDLEDSVGVAGSSGNVKKFAKAHTAPVNGLVWTDNGEHLVSVGHDRRIRVWDTMTGANTLASFGPLIQNGHLSTVLPVISPGGLVHTGQEVLFYPNETEVLMFEMFEGRLIKRLKVPGANKPVERRSAHRGLQMNTTSLAWRHDNIEMYSSHGDGQLRSWCPRTTEEALVEAEEEEEEKEAQADRKRKADVLDEVSQQLHKRPLTFG